MATKDIQTHACSSQKHSGTRAKQSFNVAEKVLNYYVNVVLSWHKSTLLINCVDIALQNNYVYSLQEDRLIINGFQGEVGEYKTRLENEFAAIEKEIEDGCLCR